jgi:hypothetical protein
MISHASSRRRYGSDTTGAAAVAIPHHKYDCGDSDGDCEPPREKRESRTRAASHEANIAQVPPIVPEILRSPGMPLDRDARAFFEPRFGHDFSGVRVRTGNRADQSARAVNALAYTVGQDVVFAAGQYAPGTAEGRELISHELTHTIEQSRPDGPGPTLMRQVATRSAPAAPLSLVPQISAPPATDCSALGVDSFDRQPAGLKAVLHGSFGDAAAWFDGLGAKRPILTAIYNRLCRFGLWNQVLTVRGVEPGERPFGIFEVPGSVGGVDFTTSKTSDLMAALLNTTRFCADSPLGGSQHKDQASFREVSNSDSLHVAVGPNPKFDAHIDRYSPASAGGGSQCIYDPTSAAAHIGREVVPSKVRSKLGIPGVQVFPEPVTAPGIAGARPQDREPSPAVVGMTWRF